MKISLNGTWQLRGEFLNVLASDFNKVLLRQDGDFSVIKRRNNTFPSKIGWLNATVPGDVLCSLTEANLIKEPLEDKNLQDSYFTRNFSWWYKKTFTLDNNFFDNQEIRLHIEMLDIVADIIINNNIVAHHENAFVAFEEDVKRFLVVGENTILIRLTSGFEKTYGKDSISYYCASDFNDADQRIYLRKPQFTDGWDWCQPVSTCGIGRDIYIKGIKGVTITNFNVITNKIENNESDLTLSFELDNLSMCSTDDVILKYNITFEDKEIFTDELKLYVTGGRNFINKNIKINNPQLWWPNGYGKANLYKINATVICKNANNSMKEHIFGIRTIEINQDKLADGSREFYFCVNGTKVMCKGGNWVPTDSIYLRTADSKYKTLVDEAKNANFTMLRMWGGGTYEPECFYEYCSENGIMLMHDFMYACAFYPDNLDWFLNQATLEANYQTKRLSHFPCMAIWTGNNEIHESYTDWFPEEEGLDRFYGSKIFNYIQPEAVKNNAGLTPYLPSSPFGGDTANSLQSGDSHVWGWIGGNRDDTSGYKYLYEADAFDRLTTRFSSEYGFFAPLPISSVNKMSSKKITSMEDDVFKFHGERDDKHKIIVDSIEKYLTNVENLTLEDYVLYGSIMQGQLYKYMCESIRHKNYGSGYLTWMYNDCWPESGWTTIDYYNTRKLSFYMLKTAFDLCKMTIRINNNKAVLHITNETPEDKQINVKFGFVNFKGEVIKSENYNVLIKGHSFNKEFILDLSEIDLSTGFAFASTDCECFASATSIQYDYKNYPLVKPELEIISINKEDNCQIVKVKAKTFIPYVIVKTTDDTVKLSNNAFMMLQGEIKTVVIYNYDDEFTISPLALGK